MGLSGTGIGAILSYVGWFIAALISPSIPDHLGVFIPILSILSSVSDIGNSSGSAIFGAFVTMLVSFAFQDHITAVLAVIAIIVGVAKSI